MDVLRALSAPNMDIRKKTLDIALDLITARNIDEVGSCALSDLPLREHVFARIGDLHGRAQALAQCNLCMPPGWVGSIVLVAIPNTLVSMQTLNLTTHSVRWC